MAKHRLATISPPAYPTIARADLATAARDLDNCSFGGPFFQPFIKMEDIGGPAELSGTWGSMVRSFLALHWIKNPARSSDTQLRLIESN